MKIGSARDDAVYMDLLSRGDTAVHRLDPRVKIVVTIVFIIAVLSFGRYEISALIPFFAFPLFLVAAAGLPALYILKKIALISPVVIFIAIFNPLFDRETMVTLWGVGISGGWVSFFSIMVKFVLTAGSVLILLASTGFYEVCMALERLGVPPAFVMQLLFLYRYLFVLMDEGVRMSGAHSLRAFGRRRMRMATASSLLGNLLLRTMDRAERIHRAMLARGFDGSVPLLRPLRIRASDTVFLLILSAAFVLLRIYDLPGFIGRLALEVLR